MRRATAAVEYRRAADIRRGVFSRGDNTSSLVAGESVDSVGMLCRPLPVLVCDSPFKRDLRRLGGTDVSALLSAVAAATNAQPLHVASVFDDRSERRNIRINDISRRSRRPTHERGMSGRGGEGGLASERLFQMGSIGDASGDTCTVTAADDDDAC